MQHHRVGRHDHHHVARVRARGRDDRVADSDVVAVGATRGRDSRRRAGRRTRSVGGCVISSGVPVCTTAPCSRMRIRSASASASTGSCVTSTRARREAAEDLPRSWRRVSARVCTSSAARGSSSSSSLGSVASARASATRCACPPESSRGAGRRLRRDADLGRGARGARSGRGAPDAVLAQPERHVVERGQVWRTAGSPGTRPRPARCSGGTNAAGRGVVDDGTVDADTARVEREQPGEHAEQRCLARAVRAEYREHLAVADLEVGGQRELADARRGRSRRRSQRGEPAVAQARPARRARSRAARRLSTIAAFGVALFELDVDEQWQRLGVALDVARRT